MYMLFEKIKLIGFMRIKSIEKCAQRMPVLFIGVLLATSVLNASEAARSSDGTTASGWSAFDQETAPIVDALKGTDARIFSNDDTI